jgi:poly(hydroxyalkanoate) depolymerase family esterase
MNSLFQKLMGQATRLTSQGDLQAATAAIQKALGRMTSGGRASGAAAGAHADDTVIDVVAREVHAPPEPRPFVAKPSVADPVPPARPHAGAGQGRLVRGTYACDAGQRDWRLYVPPHHTPANGQARALVVMLHGCTQDPDDFAAGTGMDEAARTQGFFVLYPAQAQNANPQRCWNWFKHNHQQRDQGEPAILAGLTRKVMADYAIDPQRVYVAGLSAGGAMAAILGDAYPDLYAAVGVHSGLAAGAANDLPSAMMAMQGGAVDLPMSHGLANLPGMPTTLPTGGAKRKPAVRRADAPRVPTIVFHGDQDRTVHPVNAEHIIAACTATPADDAAVRASEKRARSPNGRSYTRRLHTDGQGRSMAEHWVVHGAGHAWSGGTARGSYTDASGPDATLEMLRFFFANARRDR